MKRSDEYRMCFGLVFVIFFGLASVYVLTNYEVTRVSHNIRSNGANVSPE